MGKRGGRGRAGFTMAEMLVAVGILVILLGVAIPSVVSIRANLKMTELDDCAREIFAAAQNRLTALRSAGALDSLNGTQMEQPGDFGVTGLDWGGGRGYRYVTQDGAGALLPAGSIDETVRGGFYIIEYNRETAMVYGVFYAEAEITGYPGGLPREDKGQRRTHSPMLGYYGGSAVKRPEIGQCDLPDFYILDDGEKDQLYVKLIPAQATEYTVTVADADDPGKAAVFRFRDSDQSQVWNRYPGLLTYETGDGAAYYKLLLDSLESGKQFQALYSGSGIAPGADLCVTVSVAATGADKAGWPGAESNRYANSLFGGREGGTVNVANRRHLQNLSRAFSGVEAGVAAAVQNKEIIWDGAGNFQPIVNQALTAFDGRGNSISGLSIQSDGGNGGLFAEMRGGEVANVRLKNISISGASGSTGGLIGYARNTTVENCQVYAEGDFAGRRITAAGAVGGLIGAADGCEIRNCSASVPSVVATGAGSTSGGLVGLLTGGGVLNCYADSGWLDGGVWQGGVSSGSNAGGLAGTALGSADVKNCYALGQLKGDVAAGLLTGGSDVQITDCYSAARFAPGSGRTYGLAPGGYAFNSFYWDGSEPSQSADGFGRALTYGELKTCFAANGGAWIAAASMTSKPYGGTGGYPFPGLRGLIHYGDWPAEPEPEDDGAFKGVVYYEAYSDGAYGLAGLAGGQYVSTLKGNEVSIIHASYGILASSGGAAPDKYYYVADGATLTNLFAAAIPLEEAGVLYPFTDETLNILSKKTNSGRYVALEQKEEGFWSGKLAATYYFNPLFAKTVVSGEDVGKLGTSDYPFELRTQPQISNMSIQAGGNSYWLQTHDIRMEHWTSVTPTTWSGSVIDGGEGQKITGLDQPLFAGINYGVTVRNIRIERADMTLNGGSGGILAELNNGSVLNCTVADSSISVPNGAAAGLVGQNINGNISFCGVDGVSVKASGGMAAGLVCESRDGKIVNCFAANAEVDAPEGSAAGLVGGVVNGAVQGSYADNHVSGRQAAGFAVSSTGAISDCYALLSVEAADCAAGFLLENSWGGSLSRCYAALSSISGREINNFMYKSGSLNIGSCYYLEQEDLSASTRAEAGVPMSYDELSALNLGASWTKATAARSHPESASLKGKTYPFPLISALDHYGDWPLSDLANLEMAYYEVYREKNGRYTIAFYHPGLGLDESQLRDDLPIIQDGYALLFREDGKNSNHYNGIPFPQLTNEKYLTASWRSGAGTVLTRNYLKTAAEFTYHDAKKNIDVEYGGKPLGSGKTISLTKDGVQAEYLPLFLSGRMTVSAGTAERRFYQYLTVRDAAGRERTFWYSPHFAKSAIAVNQEPSVEGGVTACIRTERHFASLAAQVNSAYWGAQRTYVQERDLDLGEDCRYTTTYFDANLTADASYQPYRVLTDPIGSAAVEFQGAYHGKAAEGEDGEKSRRTLANLTYTAADGSGVFGYVRNAQITGLTVENVSVSHRSGTRAGGLAGSVSGAETVLENIEVKRAEITAGALAGGAVGRLSGGTVADLEVTGAAVAASRLAGGVFGQIINEAAISLEGDIELEAARVSTLSEIPAVGTSSDRNITFGTGGFAGALILNTRGGGAVSLEEISVEDTKVTVEGMTGSKNLIGHGGAAFIGNLYNDRKDAVLTLGSVELDGCEVYASGAEGESAYGLFFGRFQALCPITLTEESLEAEDCALFWSGETGGAGGAAFGGYIGSLAAGAGADSTNKLIVTLPGGSLAGVSLDLSRTGTADVGGFLGRLGGNTVLLGANTVLCGKNEESGMLSVTGGSGGTGGFVGASAGILSDCSVDNVKRVEGWGDTGGFVGSITQGEIRSCDVRMSGWLKSRGSQGGIVVSGHGSGGTGGFAGSLTGREADILECFAAVPVSGEKGGTGGFAGQVVSGRVEQSYASGRVEAEGGLVGGFVGHTLKGSGEGGVIPLLTGCYAAGNVTVSGEGAAAGFVGRSDAGTILSAYSVGTVTVPDGARSGSTGGFLGEGVGLAAEETEKNHILAAMATFYNVLQTTKVINRTDSSATAEFHDDGSVTFNDDDCRSVTEYLADSTIQIDSNVVGEERLVKGEWDRGTGLVKSPGGAVTWNVVQTMQRYPELQDGTWMARREGKDIVVYWCTEDLEAYAGKAEAGKSARIPAYRYVNSEQKYYEGFMNVGTSNAYGTRYYVLKADPPMDWQPHDMPATMTINGYFRYTEPGGAGKAVNYGAGAPGADPYCDYGYIGITRWTDGDFAKAENRLKAFPSMGPALENMLYYQSREKYPYPALSGAGCGTKPFTHWGSWWK